MKVKTLSTIAVLLVLWTFQSYSQAKKYYVDATGGSDASSGLSPSAAWKSIDKVNVSTFAAGDSILFKRGEVFRGSLVPASGSPSGYVTYSAYGAGNKPKLLGAYDRRSPSDWTNQGGNIWRTKCRSVNLVGRELLPNPDFSSDLSDWYTYDGLASAASSTFSRTTAAGEYYTAPGGGELVCNNHGVFPWDIQLFTMSWSVTALKWYRFSFKAKAPQPLAFPPDMIKLHKQSYPWTNYSLSSSPALSITAIWASYEIYYKANTTSDSSRITFYLGNLIPNGDTLYIDSLSFRECETDPEYLGGDVGNLIFNSEMSCGTKVWEKPDLNAQGKFWYDEDNDLLEMYSVVNPGNYYSNIELTLNLLIIDVSNKAYVTCDNLDLRYGTFGVQGISTHHITTRNCDFSFIGGADQYGGNRTVRYGNGVEFSCGAHDNIVERCTFNQIYDAAVTAQGIDSAGFEVYNVYFRNNVINNSEYSFEYWERYGSSRAHDIYFENNTCMNAGRGWSHSQRPDPNGTHLMFYDNPAQNWSVYIRNNIFFNAKDYGVRWTRNEDVSKVVLDHNCWYESSGPVAWVGNTFYDYATQWEAYRAATKQDANSIHGDPLLNSDLSLQASSPCIDAGITLSTVTDDFNGIARPQGAASDIGAFEAAVTLLAPPELVTPSDGMKMLPINPTLSWNKAARALKYSLMVSLTPSFSAVVASDTAMVDTAKSIGPLQYNTTYFWRVCAKNNGGTSQWSQTRSFVTMTYQGVVPANSVQALTKGYYFVQQVTGDFVSQYGAISTVRQADSIAAVLNKHLVSGVEYSSLWFHQDNISGCISIAKELQLHGIDLWLSSGGLEAKVPGLNNDVFPSQYRACSMAADGSIIPAKVWCLGQPDKVTAFDWMNPEAMNWFLDRYKQVYLEPMKQYIAGYFFNEDCLFYALDPGYTNNMRIDYRELPAYSDAVLALWRKYCIDHSVTFNGTVASKFPVNSPAMVPNGGGKTEYYPGYNVPETVGPGTPLVSFPRNTGVWAAWDDFVTTQYVQSCIGGISKAVYEVNSGNPNFKGVVYFGLHNWSLAYEEVADTSFRVDDINRWVPWGTQRGVSLSKICSLPYVDHIICETFPPIRSSLYQFASEFKRISTGYNKTFGLMVHRDDNWGLDGWDLETDRWQMIQFFQPTMVARYPISRLFPNDQYYTDPKENLFDQRMLAYRPANPFAPAAISPTTQSRNVPVTLTLTWGSCVGATKYHLQVSKDSIFSQIIDNDSTISVTSIQLGPLSNGTTYYWHVRGKTPGGASSWSSTSNYTTIFLAPQAPSLASPVDSAINVQLNTLLSWNASVGATSYDLQLATTSAFVPTSVDDSTLTTTSRAVGPLSLATTYYWRVRGKNLGGWGPYSPIRRFGTIRTTSVEQVGVAIPTEFALNQNYPNPFNPSTTIQFAIPLTSSVVLKVFDALGREVTTLVTQELTPGYYRAMWQANVPSGIYFYRLQTGAFVEAKKMVLLH